MHDIQEYQTFFTATDVDFQFLFLMPIILFIASLLFILLAFKVKIPKEKDKRYFRIFSIAFSTVLFIFMISDVPETYERMTRFEKIFQNNLYKTVEGEIANFKEYREQGIGYWNNEFTVNDIEFEYRGSTLYQKNNQNKGDFYDYTARYEGPINTNGQKVRISYITENAYNKIIKVEIKQ